MPKIFIITGVPGTGKTTLSKSLSKRLENCTLISANQVAKEKGLLIKKDFDGAFPVDLKKLRKYLIDIIKKNTLNDKKYIILEGHLLCEIKLKNATVIVLRSHLKQLEKRLILRHYPLKKLSENILSEAMDYCGIKSVENYSLVYELLGNKKKVLAESLRIIAGNKVIARNFDLLSELNENGYNKYILQ